ncbi:hypothetical protein N7478_001853 [Penicillium angulare]|uniref:uncharacterized protein n=1 Tax=Penicillium angulare TaxID=116970 RepID=UPI002541FAF9|nr:uncharacterized protein N7478_001853 [Penicillium angulare]KAJ5288823.1 hypothetical protein N7478_001853 [Penicillium angulare]
MKGKGQLCDGIPEVTSVVSTFHFNFTFCLSYSAWTVRLVWGSFVRISVQVFSDFGCPRSLEFAWGVLRLPSHPLNNHETPAFTCYRGKAPELYIGTG